MGAVNELPPATIEVDSDDVTTDESVVGNAPGCAVPSAVTAGLVVAVDAGPATTELSSVGKRAGAVGLDAGDAAAAATAGSSLFCGKAGAEPAFAFSIAAC